MDDSWRIFHSDGPYSLIDLAQDHLVGVVKPFGFARMVSPEQKELWSASVWGSCICSQGTCGYCPPQAFQDSTWLAEYPGLMDVDVN